MNNVSTLLNVEVNVTGTY